jgi:hypothetical protein
MMMSCAKCERARCKQESTRALNAANDSASGRLALSEIKDTLAAQSQNGPAGRKS